LPDICFCGKDLWVFSPLVAAYADNRIID
jgi:hypothetical protein